MSNDDYDFVIKFNKEQQGIISIRNMPLRLNHIQLKSPGLYYESV